MNQQERKQLSHLHQRLLEIAEEAPNTSTYVMGRTAGSVKAALINEARNLKELIGDADITVEQPEEAGEPVE